jgi:hypothetical protein
MAQHAAPSAPSRSAFSANIPPQTPRSAHSRKLLKGVAAQDALTALFEDFAQGEPLKVSGPTFGLLTVR